MPEIITPCPFCQGKVRVVPGQFSVLAITCPRCRCRWEYTKLGYFDSLIEPYFQRLNDWFPGHRSGWALSLILGILCLAGGVAISLSPGSLLTVWNEGFMVGCQAAMTGIGAVLLLVGVVRYLHPLTNYLKQAHFRRVRLGIFLLSVAAAVLSFFLYLSVDRMVLDDHMFSLAVQSADTGHSPTEMRDYLANQKNQRHRDEAGQRLDDLMFWIAVQSADTANSPASMRDYLANKENQRHREEARLRIDVFYDQAIAELKERAAKQNLGINQVFFDGVVAVLESLKAADQPFVTVGFTNQIESLPNSPDQKAMEATLHAIHLQQTPKLKEIADRNLDKSAILSTGQTFDPVEVASRENTIFNQLATAVRTVIKTDVLNLQRAQPGQDPIMKVAYHIYPQGGLFLYVDDNVPFGAFPNIQGVPNKTPKGLIRGYEIKWVITVRPANTDRAFVWQLKSAPLRKLNYRVESGDPIWAPYAVILYSAFFDMAGQMIRNFGLTPETPPNTFTFKAIAIHQPDK